MGVEGREGLCSVGGSGIAFLPRGTTSSQDGEVLSWVESFDPVMNPTAKERISTKATPKAKAMFLSIPPFPISLQLLSLKL